MPPFRAHERNIDRNRQRPPDGEAFAPSLPPGWSTLAAVWQARLARAASALAHAQRDAHRAKADECQAQADARHLREQADACERDWLRSVSQRETQGQDLRTAHGLRAQREHLLAKQADRAEALAGIASQACAALRDAQERCSATARKHEKFRTLRQRFDGLRGDSTLSMSALFTPRIGVPHDR